MRVENYDIKKLKPYKKNTKKHSQEQIGNVANSIDKYGFVQPIVIDKDGTIVIGHCRYEAAKRLKLKEVPAVCVDDLTESEVNALRIVDNKTNESDWDFKILAQELTDLDLSGFEFDGFDFNFDVMIDDYEAKHQESKIDTQEKVENILNLGIAQFESDNEDGFPLVAPLDELPEVEQWIPFDWATREKRSEERRVGKECRSRWSPYH